MNIQSLATVVLVLVLVVWISFRQLRWQPVASGRMWTMPIVLAVIGLVEISNSHQFSNLSVFDLSILVVELVIGLAVGAAMGAIAQFRPITAAAAAAWAAKDNRRGAPAPRFESRTGVIGLVLWVALIVIRVGVDIWATHEGSHLAAATGAILLLVAANRFARTAVVVLRVQRLEPIAAGVDR